MLYALAYMGTILLFLAPLLVAVATETAGTQAAGPVVLIVFFGAGALLVSGIRQA